MRFFRKCFLPLFTVWLAFIVVCSPYVQSQLEIKALTIDVANWPTQLTGKCYANEVSIDCAEVNNFAAETLAHYITKWPILANSPWVATTTYRYGTNASGRYFTVETTILVNVNGTPFNMFFNENKNKFTLFGGEFVYLKASYEYKVGTGWSDVSYTTYSYNTGNQVDLWIDLNGSWSAHYGNEGVSALYGTGYNIVPPVEFCDYSLSPTVLTDDDKALIQQLDNDYGTSLTTKYTHLMNKKNGSYKSYTSNLNSLYAELKKVMEQPAGDFIQKAFELADRTLGKVSNNINDFLWQKGNDGKLHSGFAGGTTRGGGAGRDYTGGGNGTHTPTACFDVDQVTFLPVGDITITPNTSSSSNFITPTSPTENIYYITNNYYVTNNYEIIEKIEKDTATDTDTPSTDTDIPPDVKPGDEWPEYTPSWIEFLGNLISGLLQGLGDAIGGLGSAIGGIANALANLVSSLINALMDLIKMLFIPSDNFMSDKFTSMSDTVKTKLPVFNQIEEMEHSIVGMLQGVSTLDANGNGSPSYVMQLPEWLGSGEFELFDFQFFEQYRTIFHAIISFCAWSLYLMRVPQKLANAIEKASK